jgi:hypothetical protein
MSTLSNLFSKSVRSRLKKTEPRTALRVERLDERDVPTLLSFGVSGSDFVIRMDDGGGNVELHQDERTGSFQLNDLAGGRAWAGIPTAGVRTIRFEGGRGNDRFVSDTSLPTFAYGLEGNDVLVGGSAGDWLDGGLGNDRLNGRGGADRLLGASGDDVLIAIDGGNTDYIDPRSGHDVIWMDMIGLHSDRVNMAAAGRDDILHRVSRFANTGADLTLDGDRIPDPGAQVSHGTETTVLSYAPFAGNPLFSSAGPRMQDAVQGQVRDGWLLAGLGAIAEDGPEHIRQRVVDFDDGTYGVRLGNSFYRVDNELPLTPGSRSDPWYAKLGAENSMWVAIVEKAFASHRPGADSYDRLNDGTGPAPRLGWGVEVTRAFGCSGANWRSLRDYGSATSLANDLFNRWTANRAVTIGFVLNRVDEHGILNRDHYMYTVAAVTRDAAGRVTSITLRRPWAHDALTYDSGLGRPRDGVDDGVETFTPAELFRLPGRVEWATM